MSTSRDPLTDGIKAERPFYQTGILLDARDFTAEQNYHRGRLARALAYLHGSGTVAGLEVRHTPANEGRPEEIVVDPGLALDRLGRLIELPRSACIRVEQWYNSQPAAARGRAWRPNVGGVFADIFIRFAACENGKTPAFATGPFDALDAFAPARVRDAWFLELILRTEHPDEGPDEPPSPVDPWAQFPLQPDGAGLREAVLASWREGTAFNALGELNRSPEHGDFIDPTSILLARALIRTEPPPAEGEPPVRLASREVVVDNLLRLFVIPVGLLARWQGF